MGPRFIDVGAVGQHRGHVVGEGGAIPFAQIVGSERSFQGLDE